MNHTTEALPLETAQNALDYITTTLINCERNADSDSIRVQAMREQDYLYAGKQLEETIKAMPPESKILFTLGDEPVWASTFSRGAYDFLDERKYELGGSDAIGPRESVALTNTHWISNVREETRRAHYGNGWLEIGVTGLARALAMNGRLTIVDAEVANAAEHRL